MPSESINSLPRNTQAEKDAHDTLVKRAKAVHLDGNATEAQVIAAEEKR